MLLPSCNEYDRAIDNINGRLDRIENTQIASLQEQINAINTTLPQLENTDKELKDYIENLQSSFTLLQQSVEAVNTKIDEVKNSLLGDIATNKSELLAQLETVKTYLQNQLTQIGNTLSSLQTKDSDLEKRIDELEKQVEQLAGMSGSTDWVNATFATLEQHNALASEVATIKGQIEAINKSISDLETRLNEKVANDIATVLATLNADIQQKVSEITTEYTEAISNAKSEITAAYTAALNNAITNVENSLKQWVNEQLSGYLTIAAAEAKLAALQSAITDGDTALQEELRELTKALEDAEKSITEAYTKAIKDAIATNNGIFNTQIATEIATVNVRIDEELASVNARISTLEQRVGLIESKIATIEEQIANINRSIESLEDLIDALEEALSSPSEGSGASSDEVVALKLKDAELKKMIDDLRSYVDTKLSNTKDWTEATFATLEQYTALTTELETIRVLIAANQASNTQAINDAITACENNMKGWVSEQLEGYYTIAQIEAKLAALQSAITEGDAALQEQIDVIVKVLADAKTEITEAYTKAINDAITTNNGVIDDKIENAISEVNTRIDNEVAALNAKITALENRLQKVEDDIATINEQIDNINNSIEALKNTDTELKEYIDSLQATADNLQNRIDTINAKIDALQKTLETNGSPANAEVLAQLNTLKAELENELSQINRTIASLQAKDAELEKKITDLQNYVDTELSKTEDWAEATFATLEQYNSLANEVATIKAQITAINTSIVDLETRLNAKIATDIAAAVATLNADIQQKIKDITDAYTAAINTAKSEITAAYTAAIESAISALETSMQSWVNEQLKGYYTISEVDAHLSALEQEFNSKLDAQKAYLEGLISALSEELKGMIANNTALISALRSDVSTIQNSTLVENANKIAENATSIATNAQNIIVNAEAISANSGNIGANTSKIAENKSAIEANAALIAENKSAIAALETSTNSAIAKNATDIANNAENIAKNAELIAKNATAINNNAEAIAQNTADIAQLQQDLATTKTEITEAYKSAISTAISTLNGELRGEIATQVSALNTRIDNEVATINTAINTLTARVTTLEEEVVAIKQQIAKILSDIADMKEDIANLIARIQSVSYVPKYSDGIATMDYGTKTAEFDFLVSPKSAVAELAKVWNSALSVQAVYTQTRAVEFINLPITEFVADNSNGVISIKVSGTNLSEAFYTEQQDAKAMLQISDGNSSLTSEYISMTPNFNIQFEDLQVKAICCKNWDTNNDGELSYAEAAAVTDIGDVFYRNKAITAFTEFKYFTGVRTLSAKAFTACTNLWKISIPENVISFKNGNATGVTSSNIAEYTEYYGTFLGSGVVSITLPRKFETIGASAFYGSSLKCINFNEGLTSIKTAAFKQCDGLTNIELPESLNTISAEAFSYCDNLINITIPKFVTTIGNNAFEYCDKMSIIYCKPLTPPISGDNSSHGPLGSNYTSGKIIYVPTESVSAYKTAAGWKNHASLIYGYDFE